MSDFVDRDFGQRRRRRKVAEVGSGSWGEGGDVGYHFCKMRLRGYDVGGLSESGSQTYIIGMR